MIILASVGCAGCGQAPPTLAGGKPVRHWVEALHDRDAKVRKKAAFKLGNIGASDPAVLPALIGALSDHDAGVRCEVILALVKYGPGAREVIPNLSDMQRRDRDARVRLHAFRAIETLQSAK